MNKRIEKLAEQAGMTVDKYGLARDAENGLEDGVDIYKFAELIVKETITEMCQQLYWHGEDQSNNPSFYKAIDKTKKHFGVEE